MQEGILIVGAGGHGKSVLSILLADGVPVAGLLDDDADLAGTTVLGVPVIGDLSTLAQLPGCRAVLGLGDNAARERVVDRFPRVEWVQAVYSGAYVNPSAELGPGAAIFPFAVVGADVIVGAHAVVSANVTVGHDAVLGPFAQLAPGVQVAGGATIGRGAMLGLGSVVCPCVTIGEGATLGAGAVAVRDVPAGTRAFGAPARPR